MIIYGNVYVPEALTAVKFFTDFKTSMVYGVLLWTIFIFKMGLWSAYIIACLPQTNAKFKSNSNVWTSTQNQVSFLLTGKYMANHAAILEPIDKHMLFLLYSSPSHTGEILLSFLDHNYGISASHLWNNIIQNYKAKTCHLESELFLLIEYNMARFNENKRD